MDSDRIYFELKNDKYVKYYTGNVQDERMYEELDNAGVTYSRKVVDTTTYVLSSILSFVLPMVLMVAVMMIFYRYAFKGGGGVMASARAMPSSMYRTRQASHSRMWQVRRNRRSL